MTGKQILLIAESITGRDDPSQFVVRPELGYFTDIDEANARAAAAEFETYARLHREYVAGCDLTYERARKHNEKIDRMLEGFRRDTNPDAFDEIAGDRRELRSANRDLFTWKVGMEAPAVRHKVVIVEPGSSAS